jgi:hypothetical protein
MRQLKLVSGGTPSTWKEDCDAATACCVEVLNPLGVERAARLADWFDEQRITPKLQVVFASNKPRTVAMVKKIAQNAGLTNDVDLIADGVQQIPADKTECAPGFIGSGSARAAMVAYIRTLPLGTTALMAAHSTSIYQIFQDLGMDTSNVVDFPIAAGKVDGFNNLWKITIDSSGVARLQRHYVLNFELESLSRRGHDHSQGEGEDD